MINGLACAIVSYIILCGIISIYIGNQSLFNNFFLCQNQVYGAPKPKWTKLSGRRLQNWGKLQTNREVTIILQGTYQNTVN